MTGRKAAYAFGDNLKDSLGLQADGLVTGNRIDNTDGTVVYADFVGGSACSDHIASGKQCPLNVAPVFISPDANFVSKIKPVEGSPLTFTAGDTELNKKTSVTLIPFFRLHDSSYSVYFRQETASNWAKIEAELEAQAEAEAALAAITVDQVQPGKGDVFFDSDYEIPEALLAGSNGTITVKLAAQANSAAGGLFYMRLLDNSAP